MMQVAVPGRRASEKKRLGAAPRPEALRSEDVP